MAKSPSVLRTARLLTISLLVVSFFVFVARCHAGGGAENVFLVVNSRSWASKTIANYYCHIRNIPSQCVFYLDWPHGIDTCDVDLFRDAILEPVVREIDRRRLGSQIDYVVYSSDFPIRVDFRQDVPDGSQSPQFPYASITGLTYLAQLVQNRNLGYTSPTSNWYMPVDDSAAAPTGNLPRAPILTDVDSQGFSSSYGWQRGGRRSGTDLPHLKFLLSQVLGCTSGRGNSIQEVIQYLQKSASADGTRPKGTVYLMRNDNVRSSARHDAFESVARALGDLGVPAKIVEGTVPQGQRDILGLTVGSARFNWADMDSTILPGAICEHFTSFGGALFGTDRQTRCTQFLRYGAAGSCGTVCEPFALWWKFPHPILHIHYARGCSLAESFYQSVFSPYQLLIVGDPLCQPFAKLPRIELEGLKANQTVRGVVQLKPQAASDAINRFELFVDGNRTQTCTPGEHITLDSTGLSDGHHEIRLVAISDSPIATQGRIVIPFRARNHRRRITVHLKSSRKLMTSQKVRLHAKSPGSKTILFLHNGRVVDRIRGDDGLAEFDAGQLGLGPVTIQTIGLGSGDVTTHVYATPIQVGVMPPPALHPLRRLEAAGASERISLRRNGKSVPLVGQTTDQDWITRLGIRPNEEFELSGHLRIAEKGIYQFQFGYQGQLELSLNDVVLHRRRQEASREFSYVPVALERGIYRLRMRARMKYLNFHASFGMRGTSSLTSDQFQSVR